MGKQITFIYPYYDNPNMFIAQQKEWYYYPADIREQSDFIVVDDCSPRWPAGDFIIPTKPNMEEMIRVYRIKEDIPWNQDGARNLAAFNSETPWLFMTDMDHMLSTSAVAELFKILPKAKKKRYYTFERVTAPDMTLYKYHPNSYFMHRDLYWAVGGYEELFAGHYGTDGHFRRALDYHSQGEVRLPIPLVRYPREVVPDASTTTLDRKKGRDRAKGKRQRQIAKENLEKGIKPSILLREWEQVC